MPVLDFGAEDALRPQGGLHPKTQRGFKSVPKSAGCFMWQLLPFCHHSEGNVEHVTSVNPR